MATSPQLTNIAIRHQVYLERLKTGHIREFSTVFEETDAAIKAVLRAADVDMLNELSPAQLEAMLAVLTEDQRALFNEATDHWIDQLSDVAVYEAVHEIRGLRAIADAKTRKALKIPSQAKLAKEALARPIQAFGKRVEDVASDWTKSAIDRTNAAIRNGYVQGKSTSQMVKELIGTKPLNYRDGKGVISRKDAATMVRTGVQQVASTGRQVTYEENADVILGYEWLSTLDNRTSSVCRTLDGKKFKTGEGPLPPIHPNCRSTTTPDLGPEFRFLDIGATRSALDGPVSAEMSYYDWLKTQEREFQDEVLGPVRGQLFREGELTTKQFGDLQLGRNFEPITLAEMEELEPLAFQRAGLSDPEFDFPRVSASPSDLPGRPKAGSLTGAVWDLGDELKGKLGRFPTRQEMIAEAGARGISEGTMSTQYSRWKKAHAGIVVEPPKPPKPPLPPPPKPPKPTVQLVKELKAEVAKPLGESIAKASPQARWEALKADLESVIAKGREEATSPALEAADAIMQGFKKKYPDGHGGFNALKMSPEDYELFKRTKMTFMELNGGRPWLMFSDNLAPTNSLRNEFHDMLAKFNNSKTTQGLKVTIKGLDKQVQRASTFIDKVCADRLKTRPIGIREFDELGKPAYGGYYRREKQYICLKSSSDARVIVHEMVHHIESEFTSLPGGSIFQTDQDKFKAIIDFLEKRRGSEKATKRKGMEWYELFDDEWAERGGRIYSGGVMKDQRGQYTATECITTGAERLFLDPLDFYRKDPEHFEITVRVLMDLF